MRPDEKKLRLGGMALRNGLLVHGPTHWAAAVRTDGGEVKTAIGPKPTLGARKVPGLRGVLRLAEAMAVIPLVKRGLPEAKLPMQDVTTLAAMLAATGAGHALRRAGPRTLGREALLATVSLMPAMLSLRSGDIAAYHGVEHKAIGAYETGEDAAAATKEHDRCGSNLVAPLLASTVIGNVAARRAGLKGPAADAAVSLGSVAFAVEVFAWADRHSDSALAGLVRLPGHEIQRAVGTREPTPEQLEVGAAAIDAILKAEAAEVDG